MGYENNAPSAPLAVGGPYRHLFPVTQNGVYLNHAAIGPLCGPARDAMRAHIDEAVAYGSLHYDRWMKTYAGLREAAARLINASPGEIAIVKNTSEGICTVAMGLSWKRGDRVVAFREEFPSNYYPWLRLEERGVQVQWLSIYDELDHIAEAVRGARLLAISYVNYLSGFRVDLPSIGRICRENHCFFFVDAIQGLGVFPLDVEECSIDALASDGHKWLLGPEGNGILYVRRDRIAEIEPVEWGWTTPAKYYDYGSRDMTLRSDAGRYECGTLNTVGCYGLKAAIETLTAVGVETMATAIHALAQDIFDGVRAKGYEVLVPRTEASGSGIVSFRHPKLDCQPILETLKAHGSLASFRQGWIRMSPHFYISREELAGILALLPDA